ncbi:MAG: sensor histidine kinase [Micromonosporaceae bacterium]
MGLPLRLFISYAVVVVIGAAVAYVTVRLLAPPLFDHRMSMLDGGHRGMGPGGQGSPASTVRSAFLSALTTALLVGVLASVVAAVLAAAFVTRRLLRPLNAVRAATRRIAAGRYQASVPVPRVPELAALAGDVNTLATELASTEARRTRLLGEVAHEMRTPLTALEGYMEGLIDGVFAPEPEVLGAASDELRRLRRLAGDLSALSRAEEQRLDLHPADADLADLARRAAGRLAPQFTDGNVTLTVNADGPLPVRADADRITQVLTNIIGNALAATPAAGAVTVEARAAGRRAEVAVSDTGVGLAAEDLERVFERFYRAPGQPRRSSGSGIGLTIARNIARAHGGEVTASSAGPGRGATFVLTLPLRTGGSAPSAP